MPRWFYRYWLLLIGLPVLVILGGLLIASMAGGITPTRGAAPAPSGTVAAIDQQAAVPQPAVMSPATAAQQAIIAAHAGVPVGRLEGQPTEIRGGMMTYAQLQQFRKAPPLDQNHADWSRRNEQVWVVVLRGTVVVPNPQGDTFRQMLLVLDAQTAGVRQFRVSNTRHELDASSLPAIPQPTGTVPPPALTATPGSPPTPAPTRVPAPPERRPPPQTPDPN